MSFKSTILIQARIGSSRLRSKVLRKINGFSILEIGYQRLKKCKKIDKIIYLIPDSDENDILKREIEAFGGIFFSGSEDDLISRYLACAEFHNIDHIIRITSDCPLVDPNEVDKLISIYQELNSKNLYISNFTPPEYSSYCNGSDIEIFSFEMLEKIDKKFYLKKDREHVTFQFWDGRFNCDHLKIGWKGKNSIKKIRLTVDYEEDIRVIEILSQKINIIEATLDQICNAYKEYNLHDINGHFDSKAGWN